jgi:hypothetical protein
MTFSRSFVLFSGAMLAMLAAMPLQAIAQDSETAKLIPITYGFGIDGGLGSRDIFACDIEGSFFRPNRSFLNSSQYRHQLPCILRDTQIRQDGDYGGGGGRPNPGLTTSYAYPDTRFNLADVLGDYRVSGRARQVSGQASSGGVAAQPIDPDQLEPRLSGPAVGKKAAAYAARSEAAESRMIPDVMEPLEARSSSQVIQLPVRTKPVVTRQIMEERIFEGEMRRAQRSNPGSKHDASERSERPPTPRSSVQRAARSRPAASRPQSSRSPGVSSAPSASSAPARAPRSSRGSSTSTAEP